jgi:hypothetical protein
MFHQFADFTDTDLRSRILGDNRLAVPTTQIEEQLVTTEHPISSQPISPRPLPGRVRLVRFKNLSSSNMLK